MTRKVILAAAGGGAVALAVLLYSWSSQTSFVTLYGGLDAQDSARIVETLRSQGVPFQLEGSGATIRVPEAKLDELRMSFAAQGLPQGGNVGFELFDGNAFTATDFVQRLNFQRGLQGELARTIETFPAIEHARVHIVLPEHSLFVAEAKPATAAVILQLRPGRPLSSDQVAGIAHLVSGAVEGLEKRYITVVDTNGTVLFDGSTSESENGLASSGTHLDQQHKFEQALEHDVQALLDRGVGAGKSAVQVRATLNFDKLETETESYAPNQSGQGTPRSATTVSESYSTNGSASTGAIPGAVANIPGANASLAAALPENAATTYQRTESTSNFEMGKTVSKTQQAPGRVERLSVSLLLDESVTPEQASQLQEAVSAAVGLNTERGDRIAMSRLPFDKQVLEQAKQAFAADSSMDKILGYARLALPIIALVLGFTFFRMLLGAVTSRVPHAAVAATAGGGALTMGGAQALPRGAMPAALPGAGATPSLPAPAPESQRSEVERQVQNLAQTRPDSVAEVVQAWLREE